MIRTLTADWNFTDSDDTPWRHGQGHSSCPVSRTPHQSCQSPSGNKSVAVTTSRWVVVDRRCGWSTLHGGWSGVTCEWPMLCHNHCRSSPNLLPGWRHNMLLVTIATTSANTASNQKFITRKPVQARKQSSA